jgi:hypothetical protein
VDAVRGVGVRTGESSALTSENASAVASGSVTTASGQFIPATCGCSRDVLVIAADEFSLRLGADIVGVDNAMLCREAKVECYFTSVSNYN